MRCSIVIRRHDRRSRRDIAGKVAVGLVSLDTLGVEVATWYLLSHGVSLDTILRVMTMPHRRRS
ncbi:hypothetical protein LP419_33095 [Massilia sp. H-1]|nr:hypothetical protein LP419_33095 [Massilia sp. H-1]